MLLMLKPPVPAAGHHTIAFRCCRFLHHAASEFSSQGAGQLATQLIVIDQNDGQPRLAKDEPSAFLQEMLGVNPGVRQRLAAGGIEGEGFI